MPSVNRVILLGNLGADPIARTTKNNLPVALMRVATSESVKQPDGSRRELTEWHQVVAYDRTADVVQRYAKKGTLLYIEGRLRTQKYVKDGIDRYSTQIVAERIQFVSSRNDGGNDQRQQNQRSDHRPVAPAQRQQGNYQPAPPPERQSAPPQGNSAEMPDDDDMPF